MLPTSYPPPRKSVLFLTHSVIILFLILQILLPGAVYAAPPAYPAQDALVPQRAPETAVQIPPAQEVPVDEVSTAGLFDDVEVVPPDLDVAPILSTPSVPFIQKST